MRTVNNYPKNKNHHIIVVAGPTSSGKSDFAVELALKRNGEIISADSRQIYRELNIGTGKITKDEMKGVPHYMLDICDYTEEFSVMKFRDMTLPIIEDIISRGKTPIICGGTGYYIDAVMYTNTLPESITKVRLEDSLQGISTEELYTMVESKDKRRAEAIDRHNRIRLIRALEILESHDTIPVQESPVFRFNTEFYLLNPSKEILEDRVHRRLLKRFKEGMLEEMKNLIAKGYDVKLLAKRGIEYKWMAEHLVGNITFDELVTRLRIATWQYAKRQRTWNKRYLPFAKVIEVKE